MYKQREWAMQIHFGAIRNNNKPMFKKVGINCGFDSVGDQTLLAGSLNALLNAMGENNGSPKPSFITSMPAITMWWPLRSLTSRAAKMA